MAKARVTAGVGMLCVSALIGGHLVHEVFVTDMEVAGQHQADVATMQKKFAEAEASASVSPSAAKTTEKPKLPGELIRSQLVHGEPFGVMYIPRFGDDWRFPIIEGTEHDLLDRGVTHESYTSLPGEKGNFGVAGHRVTYGKPFYDIDELKAGDQIIVETVEGWAVYSVTSHKIVEANQTEVYADVAPDEMAKDSNGSWITMVACHPEWSNKQRYVVFGRLVELRPRTQTAPNGVPGGEKAPTPTPTPAPTSSLEKIVTPSPLASKLETPIQVPTVAPRPPQAPVRETNSQPVQVPVQTRPAAPQTSYEVVVETIYEVTTETIVVNVPVKPTTTKTVTTTSSVAPSQPAPSSPAPSSP